MWQENFNAIENPHIVAAGDTNCTTCHRPHTERARFNGTIDLSAGGSDSLNSFRPGSGHGCTAGSSVNASLLKTINVRIFGYLHSDPVVAVRVVNETLDACSILRTR